MEKGGKEGSEGSGWGRTSRHLSFGFNAIQLIPISRVQVITKTVTGLVSSGGILVLNWVPGFQRADILLNTFFVLVSMPEQWPFHDLTKTLFQL